MLEWRRSRSYLAAATVAASLGACGDNVTNPQVCPAGTTGTPPTCTAIPPPCTQTVVESGSEAAKSKTLYFFDFAG